MCIRDRLDIGRHRLEDTEAWGVRPLNVYQAMAMHALLDTGLDLNLLIGAVLGRRYYRLPVL